MKKKNWKRLLCLALSFSMALSVHTMSLANGDSTEQKTREKIAEEREQASVIDSQTKGNWMGKYGMDGYYLFAYNNNTDVNKLPAYVENFTVKANGRNGRWTFAQGENVEAGLPLGDNNTGNRVNSALYADESIELSLDLPDNGTPRQIAVYQAGDGTGRVNGVECVAKDDGAVLFTKTEVDHFAGGKYVVFEVSESCIIRITSENPFIGGGNNVNNAIVNGIFISTAGDEIPAEMVRIHPEDGQNVRNKEDFQMKATVIPANTTEGTIVWSIVDGQEIAEIDQNGFVKVKQTGEFTVEASVGDKTAKQSVYIFDAEEKAPEKTQLTKTKGFAVLENPYVKFIFSLADGTYSVYEQESGIPYVLNAYTRVNNLYSNKGYVFDVLDVTEEAFDADSISYEMPKTKPEGKIVRFTGEKAGELGIVLEVTLEDQKGSLILANGIVNNSDEKIKLMEMYPMVANGVDGAGIFAGTDPEKNHDTMTGGGDWQYPRLIKGTNAASKNMLTISYRDENKNEKETFLFGGLSTYEFQNEAAVSYKKETSILNHGRNSMDASLRVYDFTGKLVDEGQTYVADKAFLNFTEKNPYYALENYAQEYANAMNVNLIGYNDYVSSCLWYVGWFIGDANNADYGVDQAKKMYETGMAKYAPPMIRLVPDTYTNPNEQLWWDDDHWKKFGHLTDKYPTLQAYGDGIREAGGVPGMYMQPTFPSKDYIAEHQDHMINNEYNSGPDYTDPGFIAHLQEVYENMKKAGVMGTFYDYSYNYIEQDDAVQKPIKNTNNLELTGGFEDKYATAVSAYRNIYKIAKDVYPEMAITENPWNSNGQSVAIGVIDAQRSVIDANHFDSGIARTGVMQWFRNEVTKLIDPDVKVFNMEDEDIRRAEVTGTGLLFGKTMFGRPVEDYNAESIHDIGRIFPMPVDGVSARPVGLFESGSENPEVYDYVFKGEEDDHVLLLWNHKEAATKDISVDLGKDVTFGGIGLDAEKEYDVYDFWDWRYVGRFSGNEMLTMKVRPNEMKTLAVREVTEPRILSTNRHVLQGAVDTENVSYDADAKTLTGTLKVVGEDQYQAAIMLPNQNMAVKSFEVNSDKVKASAEKNAFGYVEITVDAAENTDVDFVLELEEQEVKEDTTAPSIVTGLQVSLEEEKATLNWNASREESGAVEYWIYRGDTIDFEPSEENRVMITTKTVFADSELLETNRHYFYKVIAKDGAGNESAAACAKILVPSTGAQEDRTTGGAGWEKYAEDGSVFFNKLHNGQTEKNLPDYLADVTFNGGTYAFVRNDDTAFTFDGKKYLGLIYDGRKIVMNLDAKDEELHSVSLYMADGDNSRRVQSVSAYQKNSDGTETEILAPYTINKFYDGVYLTFDYKGDTRIEITPSASNAVISGLFFAPAGGAEVEKEYNTAPYGIDLSNASIEQNSVQGTEIGKLSALDADQNDSFVFSMAEESGNFTVEADKLIAAKTLDKAGTYETAVKVTDAEGESYIEKFVITVTGQQKPSGFTVTVDGEVKGNAFQYNDKLTVTAPEAAEGKVFAGWEADGRIVSGNKEYTFYVSNDVTLRSVFKDAGEIVEAKPDALLTSVSLTKREDEKSNVRFVGQLVIPEGYTLVNAGLVWSTKDDTELVLGGKLNPTYIRAISDTNQFSVTIKGLPNGKFLRGQIFAEVKGPDGKEFIYSSEYKAWAK